MTVDYINDNIAALWQLKQYNNWVGWKYELRDSKQTKVPKNPNTGGNAASDKPNTWGMYALVEAGIKQYNFDGIGFMLDPTVVKLVGIDLDDCIDNNGQVEAWAMQIVFALNSYTETSPSGKGLRIFLFGDLPPDGRRKGNIEMYTSGRFLTVTGNHLEGTPETIHDRSKEVLEFHQNTFPKQEQPEKPNPTILDQLPDLELIRKIQNSGNGPKFNALWLGDTTGYPSHSEADLALCELLNFYSQGDANQIDRLFRQSGLMRQKWDKKTFADGRTYGQGIIEEALKYEHRDPNYHKNGLGGLPINGQPSTNGTAPNTSTIFRKYNLIELLQRPKKQWLVENFLGKNDLAMLFGESGSGKTIVTIDLIYSLVLTHVFANKFTVSNPIKIAYCAGEGQNGLPNRFAAAANHYQIWGKPEEKIILDNLFIYDSVPQLYAPTVPERIQNFITEWEAANNGQLDLLIIDTFHSATFGADENLAKDAGLIIEAAKFAMKRLKCTVLPIHHANRTGKYRGSSAFHGAMDTIIEVKYDKDLKIGTVECFKQKDADFFETLYFKLIYDQTGQSVYTEWLDKSVIQLDDQPNVKDKTKKAIIDLLTQFSQLNQSRIIEKIKDIASRQTVINALAELEKEYKIISTTGKGNSKIYESCLVV